MASAAPNNTGKQSEIPSEKLLLIALEIAYGVLVVPTLFSSVGKSRAYHLRDLYRRGFGAKHICDVTFNW